MDPSLAHFHLQTAIRRIVESEKFIAKQHETISSLERNGCDTAAAKTVLLRFEEVHALHVAHREWLQKELTDSEASATEMAAHVSGNG
jgi:arginine repressor